MSWRSTQLGRRKGRQPRLVGLAIHPARSAALEEIQEYLELDSAPLRIEQAKGGLRVELPEIPAGLMKQPAWVVKLAE